MASFTFNNASEGLLKAVMETAASGALGSWMYPTGATGGQDPAGLHDFRLLLVGGGDAANDNGLDTAGVCDALLIGDILDGTGAPDSQGLITYQFNGEGYTPRGIVITGRVVAGVDASDRGVGSAGTIMVGALGPGSIIGSNIGTHFTDLVLYWTNGSTDLADGIPLFRYDLGGTYGGNGSSLTINQPSSSGLFYGV